MKTFFSPNPIGLTKAIGIVRIILGLLLFYHGFEIFDPETMKGYMTWDLFKGPTAEFVVYFGKSSEFVAGTLFILGLFFRPACIIVIGTFTFITFFVGHGKFWYEDQHPFMFWLFGVLYLFVGPGEWSLDEKFFGQKN